MSDTPSIASDVTVATVLGAPHRKTPKSASGDFQAETLPSGTLIGRYKTIEVLGHGGMGIVYKAYDPQLSRHVALKLHRRSNNGIDQARLHREAQALARLSHPNVVAAYDIGTHEGALFVAMEIAQGLPLNEWLEEKHSYDVIMRVLIGAGRGLAAAHRAGVLHRDLKPSNIMVSESGLAQVVDFGLARDVGEKEIHPIDSDQAQSQQGSLLSNDYTLVGTIMGTPGYIAPEQLRGEDSGPRADQFSFAVTAFRCLTGTPRYPVKHLESYIDLLATEQAKTTNWDNAVVPRAVRAIIERGSAESPSVRFESVEKMVDALERTTQKNRGFLAALGLAAIALVAVIALLWPTTNSAATQCQLDEAPLSSQWNPTRQQTVSKAFAASGLAHASETLKILTERMDQYAADWRTMKFTACEDTYVRGNQTENLYLLRSSCLQRKREQIGSMVTLLETANAALVNRATGVVSQLALTECADVQELLGERERQPEDELLRTKITQLETALDQVVTLEAAGELVEALELVQKTLESAQNIGFEPSIVRTQLQTARIFSLLGNTSESHEHVLAAFPMAARNHMDRELAMSMVMQLRAYSKRTTIAKTMFPLVKTNLIRLGAHDDLLGEAYYYHGIALANQGELYLAEAAFKEAIQKLKNSIFPHYSALAYQALAMHVYSVLRNTDAARTTHLQSLAIHQQYYGQRHPRLMGTYLNLAMLEADSGHRELAVEYWEKAKTRLNPIWIPEIPFVDGYIKEQSQQCDQAVPLYRQSLALKVEKHGAIHPSMAEVEARLGMCLFKQAQTVEALEHLNRANTIYATSDTSPDRLAQLQFIWAQAQLAAKGDTARQKNVGATTAREKLLRARDLWAKLGDTYTPELAQVDTWLHKLSAPN